MTSLKWTFTITGLLPIAMLGFSTGPPTQRTGAPSDGGVNCSVCHFTFAPANSDPTGSVRIDLSNYAPGIKQTIKVTVSHPLAVRWGFQITARLVSDETKVAGNFAPNDAVKVVCTNASSSRGVPAPCAAGLPEFAEHSNAPVTDTGAGFTFSIDWTAPAADVGDIVFYAAGNAANNDHALTGDRIYTTVRRISPPCGLTVTPTIKGAVNGASFQAPWNVGAMMSVFGANFGAGGTKRNITAGDIVAQKFPQSLACIAVSVNGQNAPIAYVQNDQINFQAPALGGVGPASVVVIANPGAPNELRSDSITLTSQLELAPACFTFDGKSIAATSADGGAIIGDSSVVPKASPAKPGDLIVIYATGLGPTAPACLPGDIAAAAAPAVTTPTLNIGGVAVPPSDISYAGVSPHSICGLYQINVKLPASLADGDIPVTLSSGGSQSATGTTIRIKH